MKKMEGEEDAMEKLETDRLEEKTAGEGGITLYGDDFRKNGVYSFAKDVLDLAYGARDWPEDLCTILGNEIAFRMDCYRPDSDITDYNEAIDDALGEDRRNCFAGYIYDHGETAEDEIKALLEEEDDLEIFDYMGCIFTPWREDPR